MFVYPHAKINLGLSVIDRRSDGFHNIETVFYPVPIFDTLTVESVSMSDKKLIFSCSGSELTDSDPNDNLCCKAYHLLDADFNLPPTRIHLIKYIPAGAGLGGGSSDAAYTLRTINELYQLKIGNEQLYNYASRLGSDCAFFLQKGPAWGTGKGDMLEPYNLSLAGFRIILIKPPILASTAEAYSNVTAQKTQISLKELLKAPVCEWRKTVVNDFENSLFKKYPQIGEIKECLYKLGAVYASMSGSGSCVYGIFKKFQGDTAKLFPNCRCWDLDL